MKRQFSGLLMLIMLFAAACAMDDRRDDRRDGRRPGGFLGAKSGWTRLGSTVADFKTERDRVTVGGNQGPFREIMFEVDGSDLEMRDIVVTFGDGSRFSPDSRPRYQEGSRSRTIDLPGERRTIRQVEFSYRSLDKRSGRATVTLYAR
jgi:hypothetical protein